MADDSSNGDNGDDGSRKSGRPNEYMKVESMVQLAITLPAACLIGWLAGEALDKHFHTEWIGIAGIMLGAIAGFIQIYTTASRYLKR